MEKRTLIIISIVASILFCGLPGLALLCFGGSMALFSSIPDVASEIDAQGALWVGIGSLCLGVFFVLIPALVGFLAYRARPKKLSAEEINQPLPPAI